MPDDGDWASTPLGSAAGHPPWSVGDWAEMAAALLETLGRAGPRRRDWDDGSLRHALCQAPGTPPAGGFAKDLRRFLSSEVVTAASSCPFGIPGTPDVTCALYARHLCDRDLAAIPGPDRAWVRDALARTHLRGLARLLPDPVPTKPRHPPSPVAGTFAFPRTARDAGTGLAAFREEGAFRVVPLDAAAAPVACRLRWDAGGEPLAMRRMGDTWLRPVMAPGSTSPIGLDDFLEAAREAPPWVDNPFLPRAPHGVGPHVALSAYASPGDGSARSRARAEALRGEALLRAGALHVIDGVVHKATVPPVLGVARREHLDGTDPRAPRDRGLRVLSWRLPGDVDAMTDQRTGRRAYVSATWCLCDSSAGYAIPTPSYGPGDLAAARALMRAGGKRMGRGDGQRHRPGWEPDGTDPVTDVDADLCPAGDGTQALRMLAGLRPHGLRRAVRQACDGVDAVARAARCLEGEDAFGPVEAALAGIDGREAASRFDAALATAVEAAAAEAREALVLREDMDGMALFAP